MAGPGGTRRATTLPRLVIAISPPASANRSSSLRRFLASKAPISRMFLAPVRSQPGAQLDVRSARLPINQRTLGIGLNKATSNLISLRGGGRGRRVPALQHRQHLLRVELQRPLRQFVWRAAEAKRGAQLEFADRRAPGFQFA